MGYRKPILLTGRRLKNMKAISISGVTPLSPGTRVALLQEALATQAQPYCRVHDKHQSGYESAYESTNIISQV